MMEKQIEMKSIWHLFVTSVILLSSLLCSNTASILRYPDFHSKCDSSCIFSLVESIPENLTYPAEAPRFESTYYAHRRLMAMAKRSIHIASFYWTLRGNDTEYYDYSSAQGEDIFNRLVQIVKSGTIDVKIAQNNTSDDTDFLASYGAQVRTLDFHHLMHGGVMHTKMWIVDDTHIYIGSSNLDWRSYTQTKEVGILIENCPCLGFDAAKLFEVYWYLGQPGVNVPSVWPEQYSTRINASSPTLVYYNDTKGLVYLSSSPAPFCPNGRTFDLDAIKQVIRAAKKFIYIAVMDYLPVMVFTNPERFWPEIDNELRKAAFERGVTVYFMASNWTHSETDMNAFLKSLADLSNTKKKKVDFQVKLFKVPICTPDQGKIPFARVNHNKYMVTDQHAYLGTSNWEGDYFNYTGGVGFVLLQPETGFSEAANLRDQLVQVFLRDWNSSYTQFVD